MKKQFLQFKQPIAPDQQSPETENQVGGAGNAEGSGANEQKTASIGEAETVPTASEQAKAELEKNGTAKVQASKAPKSQLTGFESTTGNGTRIE